MRRAIVLFSPAFILGLALVSLNQPAAFWLDGHMHREEVMLSQAYKLMERGNQKDYENALQDFLLAGNGSGGGRAIALYNLGSLALEKAALGDRSAGKDAFFYFKEALRNDPSLYPAKYNLELLIRMNQDREMQEGKNSLSSMWTDDKDKYPAPKGLITAPPSLGARP